MAAEAGEPVDAGEEGHETAGKKAVHEHEAALVCNVGEVVF